MPDLESQHHGDHRNHGLSVLLLVIMAFIFPPLPVFLLTGPRYTIWTKEFFISFLLTIFGHLPGIIFSLYIIFLRDSHDGYIEIEDTPGLRSDNHDNHGGHQSISENNDNIDTANRSQNLKKEGKNVSATQVHDSTVSSSSAAPAHAPYSDNPDTSAPPPNYQEIAPGSTTPHHAVSDAKDTKVQH